MPFDLVGFSEATPGTSSQKVAVGGAEDLYRYSGDDLYVRAQAPYLLGVLYAAVKTPNYCYIKQPSLELNIEFIRHSAWDSFILYGAGANRGWYQNARGFTSLFGRPIPLIPDEKLNAYTNNATDEATIIGLWLGNERINQADLDRVNPTWALRGIADQTVTANSWTRAAVTWSQDLPAGEYAIVGMAVGAYDAGLDHMCALARLLLKGEAARGYRPGVICHELYGDKTSEGSTFGWWDFDHWPLMQGVSFRYDQTPDIEVLSPLAYDDFEVNLLLQKIR